MRRLSNWLEEHLLRILVIVLLLWIPLYPKLPLINVMHTWVYIRLEDFLVAFTTLVLILLLLRRKTAIRTSLAKPIVLYWLAGLISLIWTILFLAPQLPQFFPHVAVLHYLRRIEYMLLFFVVVASIRASGDVLVYLVTLFVGLSGVIFYGFGQRYLGFPAFLTMNEEFSKGIPLYLPETARITSTFGGHYDLAAYLVLLIALGSSLIFSIRRWWLKIILTVITFFSFLLLLLTASRISFVAYLLAITAVLFFQKKKWLIIPVIFLSVFLMQKISGGTGVRFGKTFRVVSVVFDTRTGKPIATLKQFTATPTPTPIPKEGPTPTPKPPVPSTGGEDLPVGTAFLVLPVTPQKRIGPKGEPIFLEPLKMATISSEIATTSGKFLLTTGNYFIEKAIVYDISFTTRFQGEWPRAWMAFKRNWLLGSGYSSISLATDNDYLRSLGETGILGFVTFWGILFVLFLVIRQILRWSGQPLLKGLAIGLLGGMAGLLFNAIFIDVFEASKVAFVFWMLVGLVIGLAKLYPSFYRSLWQEVWEILSSHLFILLLIGFLTALVFWPSLKNYFVGDDFCWLKWAATSSISEIKNYFFDSQGFFYRPLAKTVFLFLQPIFFLEPGGYHLVSLIFHFLGSLIVYCLSLKLTNKKLISFLTSLFFLLHPVHHESVFWISSLSGLMAAVSYFTSFLLYLHWREKKQLIKYGFWLLSIIFFGLGLASHEVALTLPLILIFYDFIWKKHQNKIWEEALCFFPFVLLTSSYLFVRYCSGAHGLSGDYNYSLSNLPFNFVGNFLGYLGELTFSFRFIPLYQKLRAFLKIRRLLALIIGLGSVGTFSIFALYFIKRKKIVVSRTVIFCLGWMVITLLPFLGLGNMAERYVYLGSFGFLLALGSFFNWVKSKKFGFGLLIIGVIALASFYYCELLRANRDWEEGGQISKTTLLTLSSNYKDFPQESNLIFADLPVKKGLAWVFPVGLKEGILFVYRDESLKIYRADTAEAAFDLKKNLPGQSWIFAFEEGELRRATK